VSISVNLHVLLSSHIHLVSLSDGLVLEPLARVQLPLQGGLSVVRVLADISSSIVADVGSAIEHVLQLKVVHVVLIKGVSGGSVGDVQRETRGVLHSIESLLVRE